MSQLTAVKKNGGGNQVTALLFATEENVGKAPVSANIRH
jgi:hypothetical protein